MNLDNQLIVIFGNPGVGKTYVGNILKKRFGFYFYDGDANLSVGMKKAIKTKTHFTPRMRVLFFQRLRRSISLLIKEHSKIVVSQTFIKEKYRTEFLREFPNAKFILITADNFIREKRLSKRSDIPLDISYSRFMVKHFETPLLPHDVISNNAEGEEAIIKQIQRLGIVGQL